MEPKINFNNNSKFTLSTTVISEYFGQILAPSIQKYKNTFKQQQIWKGLHSSWKS